MTEFMKKQKIRRFGKIKFIEKWEETKMDIIFGVIGIGCLSGIGLYIGLEGTEILIDLISKGIRLILKKTLETKKSDDEWGDE